MNGWKHDFDAIRDQSNDYIEHVIKIGGIDHVGISSDFDGGGGIEGWQDASETGNVTLELVRRGYSASTGAWISDALKK